MKSLRQSLRESSAEGLGGLASCAFYFMREEVDRFDSGCLSIDLRSMVRKLGSIARGEKSRLDLGRIRLREEKVGLVGKVSKLGDEVVAQCQARLAAGNESIASVEKHSRELEQKVKEEEARLGSLSKRMCLTRRGLAFLLA